MAADTSLSVAVSRGTAAQWLRQAGCSVNVYGKNSHVSGRPCLFPYWQGERVRHPAQHNLFFALSGWKAVAKLSANFRETVNG